MASSHSLPSSEGLNYVKRKNTELFKSFQEKGQLSFSAIQNFVPIYNKFFSLNEINYNSINLNHHCYISDVLGKHGDARNVYRANIKRRDNEAVIDKRNVFVKFAPLIDVFRFLIGKYNINDEALYTLPKVNQNMTMVHPKILDHNNGSYVDSFFSFLSSQLIHQHKFTHGVDFYGSFLAIQNDFTVNVADDIDYLSDSSFFQQNKNVAFRVDESAFQDLSPPSEKPPLKIGHNHSNAESVISMTSVDDNMYGDIFVASDETELTEFNLREHDVLEDLIAPGNNKSKDTSSQKLNCCSSISSCSSRTSHTSSSDEEGTTDDNEETNPESGLTLRNSENASKSTSETSSTVWDSDGTNTSSDMSDFEVEVVIPRFPVNVICMEHCQDTFDNLIATGELSEDEWLSAFMQIIMILLTYQKCFSFTHNDLHTNNVMYNETKQKHLYYSFNKKVYKVPTFGRIFKIIDFGRSIYKYNGKLFCSDSYQPGSEASTMYNTEPYLNEKKPRIEPNYSFDLCRLASSVFDYLIDDLDDVADLSKCSAVVRLVYEWCLDDNGLNILYKSNGAERYPDFKLYKMIARCVHQHTPQEQLKRKEFMKYQISSKHELSKVVGMMDIDKMADLSNT
jgi:hypothetical protein